MLKPGSAAPQFSLRDSSGSIVSLKDFHGKKVVLYFYPKDNTPGCTIEAKEFSDRSDAFAARDTVIIGISKDNERSHDKFICDHDLKIILLSDPDHEVIDAYGAWREKNRYGKTYMGTARVTYLIDETGNIARVWDNVTAAGHAQAVLEAVGK